MVGAGADREAAAGGRVVMIARLWMSLPKLVRFMLVHVANGMAIGCIGLLAMIHFDIAGLGRALEADESGLATAILFFQVALTFGSVSMGVAVMGLGED